jgi:hypothetical protein
MGNINIYVRDADVAIFERAKKMLEQDGRNISEFVAEAAKRYVDSKTTEPDDIDVEGSGRKRIFKGHTLYWDDEPGCETGVFLTAKRKIAYWYWNGSDPETFEIYDTLDELWEEQDWLNKKNYRNVKTEIEAQYIWLTKEEIVERLDI